jgi:hypothetical protein
MAQWATYNILIAKGTARAAHLVADGGRRTLSYKQESYAGAAFK